MFITKNHEIILCYQHLIQQQQGSSSPQQLQNYYYEIQQLEKENLEILKSLNDDNNINNSFAKMTLDFQETKNKKKK